MYTYNFLKIFFPGLRWKWALPSWTLLINKNKQASKSSEEDSSSDPEYELLDESEFDNTLSNDLPQEGAILWKTI